MSIASEIQRIQNGVNNLKTALTNAGYTIPDGTKIDGFAAVVESGGSGGSGGGTIPTWTLTFSILFGEPGEATIIYPVLENNDIVFKTCVIDLMVPGGKTTIIMNGSTFFMDYTIPNITTEYMQHTLVELKGLGLPIQQYTMISSPLNNNHLGIKL